MTSVTPPLSGTLTYRLMPQTMAAAQNAFKRRFWRHCPRSRRLTTEILAFLAFFLFGLLITWRGIFDYWAWFLLLGFMMERFQLRVYAEAAFRNWGECALSWGESGLSSRSRGHESHYDWNRVTEIYEGKTWITILFGETTALHIPDSAFTPELPREMVISQLRGFMTKAMSASPAQAGSIEIQGSGPLPPAQAGDEAVSGQTASAEIFAAVASKRAVFRSFLHQLWRVFTFRQPDARAFRPTPLRLFFPVLLFFLFLLIHQILREGWPGEVVWWNASAVLKPFAIMALAVGFLTSISGENDRHWGEGGSLWLAFNWLLLLMPLLRLWQESAWPVELPLLAYVFPLGWLCACQTERLTKEQPYKALLFVFATYFVCCIAYDATFNSYDVDNLWESSAEKAKWENRPSFKIDEGVFYDQPRLLDEQIAMLSPGEAGKPEIFFLGVAGSNQQVFLNEIRMAQTLFADRFDTQDHALLLANNAGAARELPFANRETLRRALSGIAHRMNPEDTLFLFMTSHGSQERGFSLSLWPLEFTDIVPQTLRELLDTSGIQQRIIVVSSCYSGQFIPALENDDSLVITASAADRNSFGCSDDNEFTDFGRAYFHEALRETRSFTEAFRIASARIAQSEERQGRKPSLPQMAQGKNYQDMSEPEQKNGKEK
jgi:hypothetical protein